MESLQELEKNFSLMLELRDKELKSIEKIISRHEKISDDKFSSLDAKLIDLESRVKTLELLQAASKPG